jgi:ketosteroid isomerase-like protein
VEGGRIDQRRYITMVTQGTSATNRQFEEAIARGYAAACAAVYSDDAKILPPDSPELSDKQAAQSLWQGIIDMGVKSVSLKTLEMEEMGDTAVERGAATVDIQGEGGQTIQAMAKFIVLWKLQTDGTWKWQRDCFNFDAPMG